MHNNNLSLLKHADIERIIGLSSDMIFIHCDGIIQYINEAGIKLLAAKTKKQLIGHSIWDIYPVDVHGLVRERIYHALESQEIEPLIKLEIKDLDGVYKTVECTSISIIYNEQPAVFVIMRDISTNLLSQTLINMQYSISSILVSNISLENAITTSIKTICASINADLNRIWILESKSNLLICLAAWIKPSGTRGEIWFQGPQVMKGYWNQPEETKKVLTEDGWFKSGDIGYMDNEGYVYLVDRKEDIIKTKQGIVYPSEVENVLTEIGGVEEAIVVNVISKIKTQEPIIKAYIVKSDATLSEKTIFEHCRRYLNYYKIPNEIEFSEKLPRSATGLILRRLLREQEKV